MRHYARFRPRATRLDRLRRQADTIARMAGDTQPGTDATLYLHPQTLARLGTMDLRARMIVEGVTSGAHRSPYQGFSVDFAQHRPYVAGDDLRHLDWKVYARTDKLHLKQYQQETNLDLVVLLDCSGSMAFGSRSFREASGAGMDTSPDGRPEWSKYDHATALAAALSYITLRQGDRVGLACYADEITAMIGRSSQQSQWRQIVSTLSAQPVEAPTQLGRAMDQILAKLGNRCLIALITDAFGEIDELKSALARARHRAHDLILFQVLDRRELDLGYNSPRPFEGLEGEGKLRVDPRSLRKAYKQVVDEHLTKVERTTRGLGFEHVRIDTHDWLGPPLAAFLARRNAQIKRSKYG